MPTERRRIIFSDPEIESAVLAYCRSTGIPVPDADVEAMTVALDGDCAVDLVFAVSSPEIADQVNLDPESVLNALVAYCRLGSIPLPKAAAKRLEPMQGALSMVFDMCRDRGSVHCTLAA